MRENLALYHSSVAGSIYFLSFQKLRESWWMEANAELQSKSAFQKTWRLNFLFTIIMNHHPSVSVHLSRRREKNTLLRIHGKLSHNPGLNYDSCITHADDCIPLGPVKPENRQLSPIYHIIDGQACRITIIDIPQ